MHVRAADKGFFFSYLISFWLPVFPTFCHMVAVTVLFCTVQFCFLFDINYFRQHQIVLLSPGPPDQSRAGGYLIWVAIHMFPMCSGGFPPDSMVSAVLTDSPQS